MEIEHEQQKGMKKKMQHFIHPCLLKIQAKQPYLYYPKVKSQEIITKFV
jgi:hypothetical protein